MLIALALLGSLFTTDLPVSQLEARGFTFDVRLAGPEDGELVILLHGFPQTSYCFRHQQAALVEVGYRTLAPDQRGYSAGARPEEDEAYVMPELVGDVVALADVLGAERFHLVGHDWGSAVAWFTAMTHPERVITLTTLSVPHPFAFGAALSDPESEQSQASGYMKIFSEEDAAARMLAEDAAVLRSFYGGAVGSEEDVEAYLDVLGTVEALDAALAWYRAMGLPSKRAQLTPIAMPTMYVWSTADPTMARGPAEATAQFVQGPYRFEVLEGISHWIPEQAHGRVTTLLLEHLGQVAGSDGSAGEGGEDPGDAEDGGCEESTR